MFLRLGSQKPRHVRCFLLLVAKTTLFGMFLDSTKVPGWKWNVILRPALSWTMTHATWVCMEGSTQLLGQTIFCLRSMLTESAASLKWRRKAVWIDLLPCSHQALGAQVFGGEVYKSGRRRMRLLRLRPTITVQVSPLIAFVARTVFRKYLE